MIILDGNKKCRNLQEQVKKNMDDIAGLKEAHDNFVKHATYSEDEHTLTINQITNGEEENVVVPTYQGAIDADTLLSLMEGSQFISVDKNEDEDKVQVSFDFTDLNKFFTFPLSQPEVILSWSDDDKPKLQASLNQNISNKLARALVIPTADPTSTELVGISSSKEQKRITIGNGLTLTNDILIATGGTSAVNSVNGLTGTVVLKSGNIPISTDLTNTKTVQSELEKIDETIDEQDIEIGELQNDIDTEINARTSADTNLQNQINAINTEETLWTNNNTNVEFPAQTITLTHNFNEYEYILIIYKDSAGYADYISEEVKIIKNISLNMLTSEAVRMNQWSLRHRRALFDNQGNTIYFDNCWNKQLAESGGATIANGNLIPYKIIGIGK